MLDQKTHPTISEPLDFRAVNVTGSKVYAFSIDPNLLVEDVAVTISGEMGLPDTATYALRDDESSRYLKDGNRFGDEVRPGARLTVTPKTHLG